MLLSKTSMKWLCQMINTSWNLLILQFISGICLETTKKLWGLINQIFRHCFLMHLLWKLFSHQIAFLRPPFTSPSDLDRHLLQKYHFFLAFLSSDAINQKSHAFSSWYEKRPLCVPKWTVHQRDILLLYRNTEKRNE